MQMKLKQYKRKTKTKENLKRGTTKHLQCKQKKYIYYLNYI